MGSAFLGGSRFAAWISDGPILLRYLVHTVFPLQLSVLYAASDLSASSLWGWGAWALVLLLACASVRLAQRRAELACGWLLGIAALLPALNLVPQTLALADHYHQWALPGWLLALCLCVEEALARAAPAGARRWRAWLAVLGVLFFAALAAARVPEFGSRLALFGKAVEQQPAAAVLVNMAPGFEPGRKLLARIYRQLELPEAAERLEGR